jgi:hypothetical protein
MSLDTGEVTFQPSLLLDPNRWSATGKTRRSHEAEAVKEIAVLGNTGGPQRLKRRTIPVAAAEVKVFAIPEFSFRGSDSIPGMILAKQPPKFPTALRELLAKPLLKQDR